MSSNLMRKGQSITRSFIQDETGATAIEYGLIATLIAVAIVGGASSLGFTLSEKLRCTGRAIVGLDQGIFCQRVGF